MIGALKTTNAYQKRAGSPVIIWRYIVFRNKKAQAELNLKVELSLGEQNGKIG